MIRLLPILAFVPLAIACSQIDGDVITGADLAGADPVFAGIPGTLKIGYAPAPGIQRTFSIAELQRVAAREGIADLPQRELCFERRTVHLSSEAVMSAMEESLPGATIQILEVSRYPVVPGKLVFPLSHLSRSRKPPVLWRGRLEHDGNRVSYIWAKVNVSVATDVVIASEDLPPGRPVRPDQLKIEKYEGLPLWDGAATTADSIAGRVPRSLIRAGTQINPGLLDLPREISKGDIVHVEARVGAAQVTTQAKAATGGRRGDSIQLRIESSGKSIRAYVEGPGRAVVREGGLER